MLIETMEYLSRRLRCTDGEKDACLETVVEILPLREIARRDGFLAIGLTRADEEPNPFFRACLRRTIEPEVRKHEKAARRQVLAAAGGWRAAE